ncbi:MAG TPA: polymer-forming cytoskeletal protein [Rhodanobacteraceae bacterium]|nr:polymer-forming cytoskeletal protein [Rhodanobacteraceae bacterium]
MFGNNKRNGNGVAVAAITTLIAEGTVIRGDVEFIGGLHLDGMIEGAISADGADAVLTLSEKGRVNGEIRASNAVINGRVHGDIVVAERLELASGARIEGNVYYKVLEMAAGAQVNGKMIYQSEAPRQLASPEIIVAEA